MAEREVPIAERDDEGRWRSDINAWGAQVPTAVEPKDNPAVERQFTKRSDKKEQ